MQYLKVSKVSVSTQLNIYILYLSEDCFIAKQFSVDEINLVLPKKSYKEIDNMNLLRMGNRD